MVQDREVMDDEQRVEDAQRERLVDPESPEYQENLREEQRRMWCLSSAMNLAIALQRAAPTAPSLNITLTAEEMCEFIETGKARNAPTTRGRQ